MKKVIKILSNIRQGAMAFFHESFIQDNKNYFYALGLFWVFYFLVIFAIVKSSPTCNICGSKKFVHKVEITTMGLLKQKANLCEVCLEKLKGELKTTIKKVE